MSERKIAIPDDVYGRVEKVANAEGATLEELVTKALERELARRWLVQVEREGQSRRGDMTDDEINSMVERSVPGIPWSFVKGRRGYEAAYVVKYQGSDDARSSHQD